YIPAVLLFATQPRTSRSQRWLQGGLGVAALATFVTYANAFVPVLPVPATRDPAARAAGWEQLAAPIRRTLAQRSRGHRVFIGGDRYQEASELAFHLREHPLTYSLNLEGRANQYDLWPTFPQRAQIGDALILVVDEVADAHPVAALVTPHFASVARGELVTLER